MKNITFFFTSRNKKININKANFLNIKKDKKKILQNLKESDLILIANGPSFKIVQKIYSHISNI